MFDPDSADRLATRLYEAGDSLEYFPRRGRPTSDGVRQLPSIRPYILEYRVSQEGEVIILRVRHGRQRPSEE